MKKYLRISSPWNIFVSYKNRGEITRDRMSGLQSTLTDTEIFYFLIVYFKILSDLPIITHTNDKSNWKCTMLRAIVFIHANFFHCVSFHWSFHAIIQRGLKKCSTSWIVTFIWSISRLNGLATITNICRLSLVKILSIYLLCNCTLVGISLYRFPWLIMIYAIAH